MCSAEGPIIITVQPEDSGVRLDSYLSRCLERTSRATVQRWIQMGCIQVGGVVRKASYCVTSGDTIAVEPSPQPPSDLVPENIPLDLIFEDEDLIVINKSAGIVVHPGAGNRTGTIANALLHHFGGITQQDPLRPGIVHRLDKETSGVLLVAKNEYAHEVLSKQFKDRLVEKRYLALVHGELTEKEGMIDVPIGRDVRSRTKISTRSNRLRNAQTAYKVLEKLHRFTYVQALPRTGRTHQIRVHFHYLGHPVVGDKIYSKGERERVRNSYKLAAIRKSGRHFLHATFLRFTHPTTGKGMSFESPLPRELEQLMVTLGE